MYVDLSKCIWSVSSVHRRFIVSCYQYKCRTYFAECLYERTIQIVTHPCYLPVNSQHSSSQVISTQNVNATYVRSFITLYEYHTRNTHTYLPINLRVNLDEEHQQQKSRKKDQYEYINLMILGEFFLCHHPRSCYHYSSINLVKIPRYIIVALRLREEGNYVNEITSQATIK